MQTANYKHYTYASVWKFQMIIAEIVIIHLLNQMMETNISRMKLIPIFVSYSSAFGIIEPPITWLSTCYMKSRPFPVK